MAGPLGVGRKTFLLLGSKIVAEDDHPARLGLEVRQRGRASEAPCWPCCSVLARVPFLLTNTQNLCTLRFLEDVFQSILAPVKRIPRPLLLLLVHY